MVTYLENIFEDLEKKQIIIHFTEANDKWESPQALTISNRWDSQKELFKGYSEYVHGELYLESVDELENVAVGHSVCLDDEKLLTIPLIISMKHLVEFCIEFDINTIKVEKTDKNWDTIEKILRLELVDGYTHEGIVSPSYDFDLEIYPCPKS